MTKPLDGFTALMWAAYVGNVDIVTLLLNAGASTNLRDRRMHGA